MKVRSQLEIETKPGGVVEGISSEGQQILERLALPLDQIPPLMDPRDFGEAELLMDGADLTRISAAAGAFDLTAEEWLATSLAVLLSRLAGQERIALQSSGRSTSTLDVSVISSLPFAQLAAEVKAQLRLEVCAAEGGPERPDVVVRLDLLHLAPESLPAPTGYRLSLHAAVQTDGRVLFRAADLCGQWSSSTLSGWLRYWRYLSLRASEEPQASVGQLPVIEQREWMTVVDSIARDESAYPSELCFHQLFKAQVARAPKATALVFGESRMSYRELDERSSKLAAYLQSLGAGPDVPVAVCLDRGMDLAVSLLGVLKAGSCYVPLDPRHPADRIRMILEECGAPVVLVSPEVDCEHWPESVRRIYLDAEWSRILASHAQPADLAKPWSLAYIIYTSGSTGRPKGVQIEHRALTNLLWTMHHRPGFTAADRLLAITTISFDIATMEFFLPLLVGATLYIGDQELSSHPGRLAAYLEEAGINVLQATPVSWRLLLESGWRGKSDLRVFCGGEALPRDLANTLLSMVGEVWNLYGPTETTIYSSAIRVQAGPGPVTIGPPVGNTYFYVIDAHGQLCPPGIAGELYIGGHGVARGYWQRPELNTEKFIQDPYDPRPGARMFRTGDLVRLNERGDYDFFGRLDHQVKLRGYRIELGEIEAVIRELPAIQNAAVILREDIPGDPRLAAYFTVSAGPAPSEAELRDHVAQKLPDYMVPSYFVHLAEMPTTPSGKIDRKAMPDPGRTLAAKLGRGGEPSDEIEARLVEIFREVLRQPDFGVDDNFFEFGGYSLLAVRLFNRINRTFEVNLPITILFDAPTVAGIAQFLRGDQACSFLVPVRPAGSAPPLFLLHSYLLYAAVPEVLPSDRPIYGLRELETKQENFKTLEDRAQAYAKEILRVYPEGPCHVAGWCAAAPLAVEVARVLRNLGRRVAMVALIDAEKPRGVSSQVQAAAKRLSFTPMIRQTARFHLEKMSHLSLAARAGYIGRAITRRCTLLKEAVMMRFALAARRAGVPMPASVDSTRWETMATLFHYDNQPYPGRLTLFRAMDVVVLPGEDEALGWSEVAQSGVEVIWSPGSHEGMFRGENLAVFGRQIEGVMRAAEQTDSPDSAKLSSLQHRSAGSHVR